MSRIGPPTPPYSQAGWRSWPGRHTRALYSPKGLVCLVGPRLEQAGELLVEAGDTAGHVRRTLGEPARVDSGTWVYPQVGCAVSVVDGHVQQVCLGDLQAWRQSPAQ